MKRRSWKVVTLSAVASVGLSACSIPAALSVAQKTYGASPYLQVHFSAALTSTDPALAHYTAALQHLTFDLNEQSLAGLPIKSSLNQVNQSLVVMHGATRVATILENKSNIYFNVNFTALSQVPGMTSSTTTLATLNLLLGERWIELPYSLVAQYAHTSLGLNLTRSTIPNGENLLASALANIMARGTATPVAGGYSESGSVAKFLSSLSTELKALGLRPASSTKAAGTYTVSVTMSGSVATGAHLTVVTPVKKYGNAVVRVSATFAHQALAVRTPTSPLVITPAFIKQLGSSGSSLLGGALG